MSSLAWGGLGTHLYEIGLSNGVFYLQNSNGTYQHGKAWNGLTSVVETPTGAEPTPIYADDGKYLNLYSVEELQGTIKAYSYPKEFEKCSGSASPVFGMNIGHQKRSSFGFCYKTRIGNDIRGEDYGYKIHILYGCHAAPTEDGYHTINDSPEALSREYAITTTPLNIPGKKPTASIVIDSTKFPEFPLKILEDYLYGTEDTEPTLLLPMDIVHIATLGHLINEEDYILAFGETTLLV